MSGHTCTVVNNQYKSYMGTLKADIYYNNTLVMTLVKHNVILYADFYGELSGSGQQFNPLYPIWVSPGSRVTLKSPNLVNKDVSYSQTTTIPDYWYYYSLGELTVGFPNISGYIPIVINIQNSPYYPNCDDSYQIVIMPSTVPHYQLKTSGGNGSVYVELVSKEYEEAMKTLQSLNIPYKIDSTPNWTLEVYGGSKGDKILSKTVTGTSTTVAIPDNSNGVFIVRATIGEEVLSEKVYVK